jgi:acetyltransferase-like isoleucine patch superfamily enzyme
MITRRTHGSGEWKPEDFAQFGTGVVIEPGVLVFHADRISIGDHVYIGHQTILKGYYQNRMEIADGAWIGQQCFLHAAGGIRIGKNSGIGPGVRILTSQHEPTGRDVSVSHSTVVFAPVVLEDDCDVGTGSSILPGVTIGKGVIIGAGAVVTHDVPAYEVWAGVPARFLSARPV